MVFESLKTNTINLPAIGTISIAGVLIAGAIIFLLLRRKKTIGIKF